MACTVAICILCTIPLSQQKCVCWFFLVFSRLTFSHIFMTCMTGSTLGWTLFSLSNQCCASDYSDNHLHIFCTVKLLPVIRMEFHSSTNLFHLGVNFDNWTVTTLVKLSGATIIPWKGAITLIYTLSDWTFKKSFKRTVHMK